MRAAKYIAHHRELTSEQNRSKLAKMLMQLFEHWQIDTQAQLSLLGLSASSRAMLSRYRQGTIPLPYSQDILDRAGWLLAIHQALRSLYPENNELCYQWITQSNASFPHHQTPLHFMIAEGLIGIAKVARYLQSLLVK